ncbi:MAG: ATP-grasp domain-containing protein [Candidatus Didemnitutus sp.]|nr:ATP-grasp domain-containing protein [Candidatus Didemnitutus sp.]
MVKPLTLLLTSAGRRCQLIDSFRASAQRLGVDFRVVAVDLEPELSPACHFADARHAVPRCTDAGYIERLVEVCRLEKVDLVVPTIDPELPALAHRAGEFAAVGARAVISSPTVVGLSNDKKGTAETLAAAGVAVPRTVWWAEYCANPAQLQWPVIVKPNAGSSSIGVVVPRSPQEVCAMKNETNLIVQEMGAGVEYTVSVFFDREGRLRSAVPRLRLEVRLGEVSKGRTERVPVLQAAAKCLQRALPGARGPMCFQGMVTPAGEYMVFEFNARFGGGCVLAERAGAHATQWLLEEQLGRPSTAHNQWKEGVTMLRYDSGVFLND